jgi:hypothetical protein
MFLIIALLQVEAVSFASVGRIRQPDWRNVKSAAFPRPWAASDDGAKAFAEGLNQVAKNSAAGTVLTIQTALGVRSPLICVKY